MSNLINYPNRKVKNIIAKKTSFANRGMTLEEDINLTNEYYISQNKALIYKKPTPVQIVNVDFKKRSSARITEAYFKTPSTTDYNGVYQGFYLDFDVKECSLISSFPIRQIHKHQIDHLKAVMAHGGIAFLIIRFTKTNESYLLLAKDILNYLSSSETKSLPKKWIEEKGYLLKINFNPRLDYLKAVDLIIQENNYA